MHLAAKGQTPDPSCFRFYVRPHYKHSLKQRLSSSLEEHEVLLLLMQLCSVLSHLQKHRVVHRDLQVRVRVWVAGLATTDQLCVRRTPAKQRVCG